MSSSSVDQTVPPSLEGWETYTDAARRVNRSRAWVLWHVNGRRVRAIRTALGWLAWKADVDAVIAQKSA